MKGFARRVYSWLDAAEDPNPVFGPVSQLDPAPKSIFTQIEAMAGQWALEWPQDAAEIARFSSIFTDFSWNFMEFHGISWMFEDFRLLLAEGEAEPELLSLEAHELLLRWVNWHRMRAQSGLL